MIKIENITKKFKDRVILQGVSMEINSGDFISIRGESGSGKTTLFNILGLLTQADSGQYIYKNQDLSLQSRNNLDEIRCTKIGYIRQDFMLIENASVQGNLEAKIDSLRSFKKSEDRSIRDLLEEFELLDLLKKKIKDLSGGEKQRVAIMRALLNKPDLLLADEPTGSLDYETGIQIMEKLRDISEQGTTVVYVSHNREIADMAKRKFLIKYGIPREVVS